MGIIQDLRRPTLLRNLASTTGDQSSFIEYGYAERENTASCEYERSFFRRNGIEPGTFERGKSD
jgi:hypothetical protein